MAWTHTQYPVACVCSSIEEFYVFIHDRVDNVDF